MKINLFVPGRLCLFGEHSDWAGLHRRINANIIPGAAIVSGIEQGIEAEVEKSEQFILCNESKDLEGIWVDFNCLMNSKDLYNITNSDSFFSYAAGVVSYILDHYSVGGLKIVIKRMTLPIKKGLSSSAAICVLVARAFNLLYSLNLNTKGEMDIAFKGEQRTRSRCGKLDQACAYGSTPVYMRFDCEDISVDKLIIKGNFYWVFADLNSNKNTIKILSHLNKCYPFAETETEKNVHTALGELNQNIINKAIEYLKKGDSVSLGALMTEAQRIFDTMITPACPSELTAPILHSYLNDENIKSLTYGGKGVGSQGDGSIQFLAKDLLTQDELYNYLKKKGLTPYKLTISPRHQVRKAILPVAGYGTRLYPITRQIKKEMMPLIDKDGLLKPVILILLEQLNKAEIEEIIIVVGEENDIKLYQDFFQNPINDAYFQKLPLNLQEYESKLNEIGKKIIFKVQSSRLGFGHAVYQCNNLINDEPALLLLGDTVYNSFEDRNCTQQLIDHYDIMEKPLIAIHKIPLEQVSKYGIVSGNWLDDSHTKMEITKFVEKPKNEYAKENLFMNSKDDIKEYYSVFGQYILPPGIFKILKDSISNKKNTSMEIDMTGSLNAFIGKGLIGVVLNGTMHDIGNPLSYKETFISY